MPPEYAYVYKGIVSSIRMSGKTFPGSTQPVLQFLSLVMYAYAVLSCPNILISLHSELGRSLIQILLTITFISFLSLAQQKKQGPLENPVH